MLYFTDFPAFIYYTEVLLTSARASVHTVVNVTLRAQTVIVTGVTVGITH